MPPAAEGRLRRAALAPGLLALLVALAVAADGLLSGAQPATVTTAAVTPLPVSLTAVPLTGTTVTSGTVASTSGFVPGLVAASTLTVARQAPSDWTVVLAVTSATGLTGGETLVVAVAGASVQSLSLAPSTVYPQATAGLTLDGTGLLVTAATLNLVAGCHSCQATLELRITPAGSPRPSFVYPYTFATAA